MPDIIPVTLLQVMQYNNFFFYYLIYNIQHVEQYSEMIQYNRHTCALPVHVMILVQCVRFVLNAKMAGVIIQRSCEYSLLACL